MGRGEQQNRPDQTNSSLDVVRVKKEKQERVKHMQFGVVFCLGSCSFSSFSKVGARLRSNQYVQLAKREREYERKKQ